MSACPWWNPGCAAARVVGDVVGGVRVVTGGIGTAVGTADRVTGAVSGHFGLIMLELLVLAAVARLFVGAKHAGEGAAAAFLGIPSGGGSGGSSGASKRQARAGGRSSTGTSRRAGVAAGSSTRRRIEATRGPQPVIHTGQRVEIVDRRDDQLGRPRFVEVCAANPAQALAAVDAKLATGGRSAWRPKGTSKCDLAGKSGGRLHYRFTKSV